MIDREAEAVLLLLWNGAVGLINEPVRSRLLYFGVSSMLFKTKKKEGLLCFQKKIVIEYELEVVISFEVLSSLAS